MTTKLSAKFTLWINRLLAAAVGVLLFAMPGLLEWYQGMRPLGLHGAAAISFGFYLCVPPVLYALWCIDRLVSNVLAEKIFIQANVRYIREYLPESAFLKAQSLTGSAFTAGTLIAVVGGGTLLDAVGVRNTLYIGECFSLLGAVMLTLSVVTARRVSLDKA